MLLWLGIKCLFLNADQNFTNYFLTTWEDEKWELKEKIGVIISE